MGAEAGCGLIPAFPGGHRGCLRTRAPRSAAALSANRASWVPPSPYCSDRWRGPSRCCSELAGQPDAPAGLLGFPLPRAILKLLLASGASTGGALRAGGPRLTPQLASRARDKEAAACSRASPFPEVSGAKAWRGLAARPRSGRSRRGLPCCSESNTAPTWAWPAQIWVWPAQTWAWPAPA